MLSLFPNLYNYAGLVPVIFRLFLAYFLIRIAFENFVFLKETGRGLKIFLWSFMPFIGGLFLIFGFLVQPTAIVLGIIFLGLVQSGKKLGLARPKMPADYYLLMILTLLSLIFLGPGVWSIDLPL